MRRRMPFHEAWIWLALLFALGGYAFGLLGLLTVSALLLVVLLLAWYWNRQSLEGVLYRRWLKYRRGFPGEPIEAAIAVSNRKSLPLVWLRMSDRWPYAVGPEDESMLAPSHRQDRGYLHMLLAMRGQAQTRRPISLELKGRGHYRLGPVEASSGDPFGLFVSHDDDFAPTDRLVVFPELRPLDELGLEPQDPFGERASRRELFEDVSLPMGVRDYRSRDPFGRIHWPATARVGRLQTRVFQPIQGSDLVVCLNVSTFAHHWEGSDPEMLERLISTAGSLVVAGANQGYRVGLLSNGSIAHAGKAFRIAPGRSKDQLANLLESLAGLTPVVTAPFERYLLDQAPRLEYGSIFAIVTSITPSVLLEAVARLKTRNRKTLLISLGEEPPPFIKGVDTYYAPPGRRLTFS